MAGISSFTDNPIVEAVRAASRRILGTGIVNRKEPISSSVINDNISRSNLRLKILLYCAVSPCMLYYLPASLGSTIFQG